MSSQMKNDQRFVKLIEYYSKGFRKLIAQFQLIRLSNRPRINRNFQIQKTKKAIVYQKIKNMLILTVNFRCKFDCFVSIPIKINCGKGELETRFE